MTSTRRDFLKTSAAGSAVASMLGFDLAPAYAEMRTLKIARASETRSTYPYCSAVDSRGRRLYLREWNHEFMDVPLIEDDDLNRPTLATEDVNRIVHSTSGRERIRYVLLAASGMRIGEETALDVEHIVDAGSTVHVRYSIWRNHLGKPKQNSVGDVDLASVVATLLNRYLNWRVSGQLFPTSSGRRESGRNALRSFHALLKRLGIERRGFYAFRRFRTSVLRTDAMPGKDGVPEHLINYWIGHKDQTMNGRYDYSSKTMIKRRRIGRKRPGAASMCPRIWAWLDPMHPRSCRN